VVDSPTRRSRQAVRKQRGEPKSAAAEPKMMNAIGRYRLQSINTTYWKASRHYR
jgi:hypothetical protein